jgi:hypothetical protein
MRLKTFYSKKRGICCVVNFRCNLLEPNLTMKPSLEICYVISQFSDTRCFCFLNWFGSFRWRSVFEILPLVEHPLVDLGSHNLDLVDQLFFLFSFLCRIAPKQFQRTYSYKKSALCSLNIQATGHGDICPTSWFVLKCCKSGCRIGCIIFKRKYVA